MVIAKFQYRTNIFLHYIKITVGVTLIQMTASEFDRFKCKLIPRYSRVYDKYLVISEQLFQKEHPATTEENNLETLQKLHEYINGKKIAKTVQD